MVETKGFRSGRATEQALAGVQNIIVNQLERMVLGVLLDISAAFNCIEHSYFLSMLEFLGYDDTAVRKFGSYLEGRRQVVEVGNTRSTWAVLDIGTPLGSVLGPSMFLVYMNFVPVRITGDRSGEVICYVDDTSLIFDVDPAILGESLRGFQP